MSLGRPLIPLQLEQEQRDNSKRWLARARCRMAW